MIWHQLQSAKMEGRDLRILFLDLANAFGSIPHSLIWTAFNFFYIPNTITSHSFGVRTTCQALRVLVHREPQRLRSEWSTEGRKHRRPCQYRQDLVSWQAETVVPAIWIAPPSDVVCNGLQDPCDKSWETGDDSQLLHQEVAWISKTSLFQGR